MRMHLGVPLILSPTYINPCYLPTQTYTSTHNEDELIIIIIVKYFAVIIIHRSYLESTRRGTNNWDYQWLHCPCFVCNKTWCTYTEKLLEKFSYSVVKEVLDMWIIPVSWCSYELYRLVQGWVNRFNCHSIVKMS